MEDIIQLERLNARFVSAFFNIQPTARPEPPAWHTIKHFPVNDISYSPDFVSPIQKRDHDLLPCLSRRRPGGGGLRTRCHRKNGDNFQFCLV